MVTIRQNTFMRVLALFIGVILLASCFMLSAFATEAEDEETAAAVMNPNYSFTATPAETEKPDEKDEKEEEASGDNSFNVTLDKYSPGFSVSIGSVETDENGNYIFYTQNGSGEVNQLFQGAIGTIGTVTTVEKTPKIVYVLAAAVAVCLCVIVVLVVLLVKKKKARMRTAAEMAYESKSKYVG